MLLWPALTLSASGVYQGAKLLPGISHILSYLVAVSGTLAVVGTAWGLVRLIAGHDWVKELARQPPLAQLVLAPLECLAAAGVGALIFRPGRSLSAYLRPVQHLRPHGGHGQGVPHLAALAAVLIIGLGPGLGEELWCRAFLGRGLVGRHGVVMGVILTSLFFGASTSIRTGDDGGHHGPGACTSPT